MPFWGFYTNAESHLAEFKPQTPNRRASAQKCASKYRQLCSVRRNCCIFSQGVLLTAAYISQLARGKSHLTDFGFNQPNPKSHATAILSPDLSSYSKGESPNIMDPDGSSSSGGFGPVHVIKPSSKHTHTAVMLHGRGSNGPEFAEEIAETAAPGQKPLTARFPTWRWVFLSSQELWSTAFQETLPAWFEAHSLTDTSVRQDMQMDGIRYSVAYIHSVLDREVARLGGDSKKLILIGISQGAAIALWALLCQQNLCKRFGALVGASAWLPFAATIQKFLSEVDGLEAAKKAPKVDSSDVFAAEMLSAWGRFRAGERTSNSLLHTPVFLGHGVDDAVVDIELGREARKVLAEVGFQVEWKEYSGAEQEGHWLKEPEQVDDMAAFLERTVPAQRVAG